MPNKPHISYRSGYKYQLAETYQVQTPLLGYVTETRYIQLGETGLLTIYAGYCWDGPSGIAIDTKNFMRGSLVHDALYQLIREERLPQSERFIADKILQYICREDGMCHLRAWYVFHGVDKAAGFAADPANKKQIKEAP